MTDPDKLLARQAALQSEATRVLLELDLVERLAAAGVVEQIGSSVSGLMVWRDLDLSVTGPEMTLERILDALRPVVLDPGVLQVLYRRETGPRSPTGRPADERHYFVLRYQTAAGDEWKIDLSFWLCDAPRSYRRQLEQLASRLTEETRLAILSLKEIWCRLPSYPEQVSGVDVYDAVLEHGVRTAAEFSAYLEARGLPPDG